MNPTDDNQIPRWEKVDTVYADADADADADGSVHWVTGVRAVCEPDGYCRVEHRCGKLNIGIIEGEQ